MAAYGLFYGFNIFSYFSEDMKKKFWNSLLSMNYKLSLKLVVHLFLFVFFICVNLFSQISTDYFFCLSLFVNPGSEDKASACNAGDPGSIPGLGRSPGEGNGNPLQYPCLENPMERGAWRATVHGVAKSWTRLSDFTFHFPICES